MTSYLSHLECARCGKLYSFAEVHNACECGGPLFCRYRLSDITRDVRRSVFAQRPGSLWRYEEFLPVQDMEAAVTLGEGYTPLVPLNRWGPKQGLHHVYVKDEGKNPTGTFKARGAAVAVTRLRELGIDEVVVSSSGNAGDAWAAYCTRAGIRAHIVLPDDATESCLIEAGLFARPVHTFGGHISRGARIAAATAAQYGVFCADTFKEPYRVEGKKTMGLEIAEQLGWRLPAVVVYPTGGGVGLIGIWKAFQELISAGWVDGPMPRFVSVQYEGCAPIVEAFSRGRDTCEPWGEVRIVPGGMRSSKPLADFLILRTIRETRGLAVKVRVDEVLHAVREVAETEGLFVCPEGATTFVALKNLAKDGTIGPEDIIVAINTGNGLKYASLFKPSPRRLADDDVALPLPTTDVRGVA